MKKVLTVLLAVIMMATMSLTSFAMQIQVKTSTGKTVTLEVDPNASIADVKNTIREQENIAVDDYDLRFNGTILEDDKTFSYYGIEANSTLQMTLPTSEQLTGTSATGKDEGRYTVDIIGVYTAGSTTAATKISVDISWEKMEFTYTAGGKKYNTGTHQTETSATGKWSENKPAITVTNHSNSKISASFSFTPSTETGVTGTFYSKGEDDTYTALTSDEQKLALASGENQTDATDFTPPSGKIYFGVSGAAIEADKTLGTITVKIANEWKTVTSVEDLQYALYTGGNIQLGSNMTGSDAKFRGSSAVIDLNGKTLTLSGELEVNSHDATLTVIDSVGGGKITNTEETESILVAVNDGTFVLESGSIISNSTAEDAIRAGGTMDDTKMAYLIIKGGSVSGGISTIYVGSGATATVIGGTFSDDPTSFVDTENYTVTTNNDGTYTVTKKSAS